MIEELKTCPFCDAEPIWNTKDTDRVNCSAGGCYLSETWRPYGITISEWQHRPREAALQARAEKAEDKLNRIEDVCNTALDYEEKVDKIYDIVKGYGREATE